MRDFDVLDLDGNHLRSEWNLLRQWPEQSGYRVTYVSCIDSACY
jgi:hypothetical protein